MTVRNKELKVILRHLFFSFLVIGIFIFSPEIFGQESNKDKDKQKTSGLLWLPVIYYTPETKWAFGVGGMYYFRAPGVKLTSRPSNIGVFLVYTLKKQFIVDVTPDFYLKNEEYRLEGNISFSKFVDKFYGIGNETSFDDEENFTSRITRIRIHFLKRLHPKLKFGFRYNFEHNKITEVEEDGKLENKDILGSEGGTASGLGLVMHWDTRDNVFSPSSGNYHQLSATLYRKALGSDYDFTSYNFDLRRYVSLFSSHVLAFQGYVNFISGDPPFQSLSLIGGDETMRGYYLGRYRDKNMIAVQMEYRMPLWKRIGLVGFVGYGDVAAKISHFDLKSFRYSVGFGLRYMFSPKERLNLRLDVGFGEGTAGVYFTASEAF